MTITAIVRALVESGATPQMILAAVEAAERDAADKLAQRRASDAARQAAKRERDRPSHVTSRDVTVTVPSHAGARARGSEQTSSSVPPKEEKEERKIPLSAERLVKRLLPEGWEPSASTLAKAEGYGFSAAEITERVSSMREWSRGKGEKRLDWDLVFQGFLRRDAEKRNTGSGSKPTELAKWEGPNGRNNGTEDEGVLRSGGGLHRDDQAEGKPRPVPHHHPGYEGMARVVGLFDRPLRRPASGDEDGFEGPDRIGYDAR